MQKQHGLHQFLHKRPVMVLGGALLAVMLAVILVVGWEPRDSIPGFRLPGELVTTRVEDWSFTDQFREIYLETRTWYFIPHSVTTFCASDGDRLYLFSIYSQGGDFPEAKFWTRNVARDPRVRLKIGNRLFQGKAFLIKDPEKREAAQRAFARKYTMVKELLEKPESERPRMYFLHVQPD